MRGTPLAGLGQKVARDCDGDLARRRLDEDSKRIYDAVNEANQQSDDHQESEQARHIFAAHIPPDSGGYLGEYDHVPLVLARACGLFPWVVSAGGLWDRGGDFGTGVMSDVAMQNTAATLPEAVLTAALGRRSIVLVGMMGAGKSSIGRRLAARLGLAFVDADAEIEKAAGMTIPEIFAAHGEPYFRAGEARVIARLLESGPQVLATGGGAFMNPETRSMIRAKGISVWLNATLDTLTRRIKRRADRPMLAGADHVETLKHLMDERYPVYAEADLTVESRDVPHETIVEEIIAKLCSHASLADADNAGTHGQ
jgi:shikimate kinase